MSSKLKRLYTRLIRQFRPAPKLDRHDFSTCFFIPDKSKGWILEAAMQEIAQRMDTPYTFEGNYKKLPEADCYYFCHYHFYLSALRINPWIAEKNCFAWFTHPKEEQVPEDTIEKLQSARVITMSAGWKQYLVDLGLSPDRVTPVVGAADPTLFQGHQRGCGKIGFCSAFYERKSPERVFNLVRAMPQHEFVLMGRKWEQFEQFDELNACPNFEYRQGSYVEYPAFYRDLDVFVSVSQLEGGPIPLLESMLSNVVPVATNTGFAPDVIVHGENGFLFDAYNGSTEEMVQLVRQALELKTDIRETALPFSWDHYAKQHIELFREATECNLAKNLAA